MILGLPQTATAPFCPSEVRGQVHVPSQASFWKKWGLIAGPGLLVSIGYVDPGNWATDIAAGTSFGYDLLFVILLSSMAAIFLQILAARVGVVTGKDLAQLSRDRYPKPLRLAQWGLAELAIIACDLAEVLGSALAFHLLFGCSLTTGIWITVLDMLIILGLKGRGFRQVEAIILGLLLTIAICFAVQLALAGPDWGAVLQGSIPSFAAINSADRLYLAIGIIGATVMPHNLYLHSSIVQTRKMDAGLHGTRCLLSFNRIDTISALAAAFLINAAILVLAAAAFHDTTAQEAVRGIEDAHNLLTPLLGSGLAAAAFAIALLASGQSATFTGTIAGQVILEGYLNLKIPCWLRRIVTRSLALIPALIGVSLLGDGAIDRMLVFSQVVLGLQLPFVIYPLLRFAADTPLMGPFALGRVGSWAGFGLLGALTASNLWLLARLANLL
jgi:manganese transport protein